MSKLTENTKILWGFVQRIIGNIARLIATIAENSDEFLNKPRRMTPIWKDGLYAPDTRSLSALVIYLLLALTMIIFGDPKLHRLRANELTLSPIAIHASWIVISGVLYLFAYRLIPRKIGSIVPSDVPVVILLVVIIVFARVSVTFDGHAFNLLLFYITAIAVSLLLVNPLLFRWIFRSVARTRSVPRSSERAAEVMKKPEAEEITNYRFLLSLIRLGVRPYLGVIWIVAAVFVSSTSGHAALVTAGLGAVIISAQASDYLSATTRKILHRLTHAVSTIAWGGLIPAFLSVSVVTISVLYASEIHYVAYILDTNVGLLILPLFGLYLASWFFVHWTSRCLSSRLLMYSGADHVDCFGYDRLVVDGKVITRQQWIQSYFEKPIKTLDNCRIYTLLANICFLVILLVSFVFFSGRLTVPSMEFRVDLPEKPVAEVKQAHGSFDLADRICQSGNNLIALAASGGGSRAALNTYYFLRGLRAQKKSKDIIVASGVSGGTAALAYYASNRSRLESGGIGYNLDGWNRFEQIVSHPFIHGVVERMYDWNVVAATTPEDLDLREAPNKSYLRELTTTTLLRNEFERTFGDEEAMELSSISKIGLIFNTTVVGTCENYAGEDQNFCVPTKLTKGGAKAGLRMALTNLSQNLSDPKSSYPLVAYDLKGKGVTLSDAVALSGNFPPVFEDAPINIQTNDGLQRVYVTDGGVFDNRGTLTLLIALKEAFKKILDSKRNKNADECDLSGKTLHIVELNAGQRRELEAPGRFGLKAALGARTRLADNHIDTLRMQIDKYAEKEKMSIATHRLSLPDSAQKVLRTHWQLPPSGQTVELRSSDRAGQLGTISENASGTSEEPPIVEIVDNFLGHLYDLPEHRVSEDHSKIGEVVCWDDQFFVGWLSLRRNYLKESSGSDRLSLCSDQYGNLQFGNNQPELGTVRIVYEGNSVRSFEFDCRSRVCNVPVPYPDEVECSLGERNSQCEFGSRQSITYSADPADGYIVSWVSCDASDSAYPFSRQGGVNVEFELCANWEAEDVVEPSPEPEPAANGALYVGPTGTVEIEGEECDYLSPCDPPVGTQAILREYNKKHYIFVGWQGAEDCGSDCVQLKSDVPAAARFLPRHYYFPTGEQEIAPGEYPEIEIAKDLWSQFGVHGEEFVIIGSADEVGNKLANEELGCARARYLRRKIGLYDAKVQSIGRQFCKKEVENRASCRRGFRRASLYRLSELPADIEDQAKKIPCS